MAFEVAALSILIIFIIGYLAIIFEHSLGVNKTASALVMAVLTWTFFFLTKHTLLYDPLTQLGSHLNEVSQIIFFLLGAMTLVELVDSHQGFRIVTDLIQTSSKKRLLWILGFVAFFLSAVLDNLTTTIVMVSLLRKLIPDQTERLTLGSMIVIAANAGGAWTPIGDVTTTMLWIKGNISALAVMKQLFLPSFASLIIALLLLGRNFKGRFSQIVEKAHETALEPGAKLIFWCGLGGLIFVPIFRALTGLPPFMSILIALGFLWILTDLLHQKQERRHLLVPYILTRIDVSGVLFFFGILLCIGALDAIGLLEQLALFLNQTIGNLTVIMASIGLLSAVVDNVPLVAAGMGMYNLSNYPPDSFLWHLLAYCAGTGGSILVIGSAAGVALMGLEKVTFLWYWKRISLIAALSYFGGLFVYLLQTSLFS